MGCGGDFTTIHWVSKYLQCLIHVWNKINAQMMMKVRDENWNTILNIVLKNTHFEPIDIFDKGKYIRRILNF